MVGTLATLPTGRHFLAQTHRRGSMAKKKDYDPKEPGQNFDEIQRAQRKLGHEEIGRIDKSAQRDREELKQLADEAMQKLRQRTKSDHPHD